MTTQTHNPFWKYKQFKQTQAKEYLDKIRPVIVELISHGFGRRMIAAELNKLGHKTLTGKVFTEYNVKTVLEKLNLKTVFQVGGEA